MSVAKNLIQWYKNNGRDLPWRHTKDPYLIWLSEIILQQTRVEQGMPYYHRFVDAYPTVKDFAEADEEAILRLWQGLGYYSRARNMHKAARLVMTDLEGRFPNSYPQLLKLPGVGEYTAAAISSFASNEKQAVVDGNVFRVLSRYFGIDTAINTSAGKKQFGLLANELIPETAPGTYNHAIMDFGAMICKPKAPLCEQCVLRLGCVAYQQDLIDILPVKLKGKASRNRYFHYIVVENQGEWLLTKRGEGDVWANMYEFPLIETPGNIDLEELMALPEYQRCFGEVKIIPLTEPIKHILSHQNIYARFYQLQDPALFTEKNPQWNYYNSDNLDKLAKHKLIFSFINKYIMH